MSSLRKMSFRTTESEKNKKNMYKSVFVHLLDNNQTPFEIDLIDAMNGSALLDKVCLLLGGVLEKDYFGLRYAYKDGDKRWLSGREKVHHQMKKAKTSTLSLRVKHYPGNPVDDVVQDVVRYFFYLQLRRDLFSGNILVKGEALTKLISLAIQAEHGDLTEPTKEDVLALVISLNIIENVNSRMVEDVCKGISSLNGLDCKEAEKQFLGSVSQLESYGVEPYSVLDQAGEMLFLAMNHQGICTFIGEKRMNIFYWENISRMMFMKRSFVFEINIDNKKRRLEFKLSSEHVAKEFWKWALDRQYFMTLNNSSEAKKVRSNNVIFSRKSTYKFSGKSLKELTVSCQTLNAIPQPPIVRTRHSAMIRSNSFKAVCRHSVNLEAKDSKADMYATMPRASRAHKNASILCMDFENDGRDKSEIVTSTTSEESILISGQPIEDEAMELPVIAEDRGVEETIESKESNLVQSCFVTIEDVEEESGDGGGDEEGMKLRERGLDLEHELIDRKIMKESLSDEYPEDSSTIVDNNNYRTQSVDGMFFVKFVVVTTSLLLLVMITSLVLYYHYRSSTIADLNKQKYSSEWNKNIDLESIKRFVLRNDAP